MYSEIANNIIGTQQRLVGGRHGVEGFTAVRWGVSRLKEGG